MVSVCISNQRCRSSYWYFLLLMKLCFVFYMLLCRGHTALNSSSPLSNYPGGNWQIFLIVRQQFHLIHKFSYSNLANKNWPTQFLLLVSNCSNLSPQYEPFCGLKLFLFEQNHYLFQFVLAFGPLQNQDNVSQYFFLPALYKFPRSKWYINTFYSFQFTKKATLDRFSETFAFFNVFPWSRRMAHLSVWKMEKRVGVQVLNRESQIGRFRELQVFKVS